jgi:hypothetical protein
MRVRLNLATKPLLTHRRFLAGAAAVAAVGAIVFLAFGWHVYAEHQAAAKIDARMQALRAEKNGLEIRRQKLEAFFNKPENAKLSERAAYVNTIIDESGFLWTQMFTDFEHVKPAGVRLLSISPKRVNGSVEVKLKVGAVSEESKLKFLRALEGSKAFSNVLLLSDQAGAQAGGDPEVLEVSLIYTRA